MKRILITTETFTIGGLETHLNGEVATLSRLGFEVHLAVGQDFSNLLLPKELASLTSGLNFGPKMTLASLVESVEKLRCIIRSHKIECVHAHPFVSLIPSCIAAELEGIALAITLHGPASLQISYGYVYDFLIKAIILPQAGLVVAVSDEVAQLSAPYVTSDELVVLPNSISISSCTDAKATDPRWLIVSRLDSVKIVGVLDLIEKAHAIGAPGVRLVGDGPAMQQLRDILVAKDLLDFVELMGMRVDVRGLMNSSSCVAGMGRVALEGLAEGRHVILVGYDGVKGVLGLELFHNAKAANFSGRNLPTVDLAELKNQLIEAKNSSKKPLMDVLQSDFSEDRIWARFVNRLHQLPLLKKSVLGSAYLAMRAADSFASETFLQSTRTLQFLVDAAQGKSHFDPRLIWSLTLTSNSYMTDVLAIRNGQITSLSQEVMERDAQITSLSQEVMERDAQITSVSQGVVERDAQITSLSQGVVERDAQITSLSQGVVERDAQITSLSQEVVERDAQITSLSQEVVERDAQITTLSQEVVERDGQITTLSQTVDKQDALIAGFEYYKNDKEIYIAQLRMDLQERERGFEGLTWRISQAAKRLLRYVSASITIVRTRGLGGLFNALRTRLMNQHKGRPHELGQLQGLHSVGETPKHLVNPPKSLLEGDLVVFTGVPFDDVGGGQRAAQLARCALKTGRQVVYIYFYKKFDFEVNRHVESNVIIQGLNHLHIDDVSPETVLQCVSSRATVLFEFPHPAALPYLRLFNARGVRTVFELIDDWETSLGGDWFDIDVYRLFVTEARCVVGTANLLVKRLQKLGRTDALYLPNAANEYIFDKYKSHARPADLPVGCRHVALYFGSLYGEWFAWDYLHEAATHNTDIDFVLIGDRVSGKSMPGNVHMIGAKKIDELPSYLAHSDFGLLPFSPGNISDAVSPIKVFEYLFSGKPVVSTLLPEVIGYPGVAVARTPLEFARLCARVEVRNSLDHDNDAFISKNSWFGRLDALMKPCEMQRFSGAVSVIILIHNNRNIIGRCLETLLHHCARYLKEVIVVDNASNDGGAEHVTANFPTVRVIQNPVNGCSSGRNLGVASATAKYLAFFDSDQWFTSSSCFEEALTILERNASVGVVGWAAGWFDSNHSDLGGMITDYCPNRAMNEAAVRRGYRSDIGYLGTGGFFTPKAVFDATQGFDMAYDPTCFEDTDLSFQIRCLGFEVCYRDLTGIRHQPHQTTSASSGSDSYKDLFKRNATYFKKKWADYPHFFLNYPD